VHKHTVEKTPRPDRAHTLRASTLPFVNFVHLRGHLIFITQLHLFSSPRVAAFHLRTTVLLQQLKFPADFTTHFPARRRRIAIFRLRRSASFSHSLPG